MPSIDATSNSGVKAAVASFNWNHTVSSGSDRMLVVCIIQRDGNLADIGASSVTANGDAMTLAIAREGAFHAGNFGAEIWVLPNPDVGTYSIAVTLPGTSDHAAGFAISLFDAEQSTTPDDTADALTNNFGVDDPSLSLTTLADDSILIDACYNAANNADFSVGSGQTAIAKLAMNGGGDAGGASYKEIATAGGATMSWDVTDPEDDAWVAVAVAIAPPAAPPGATPKQLPLRGAG